MGEIRINDWDSFRSALAQLNGLAQQIPARRDAGAKVTAAVAAAADNDGTAAPAYSQTQTALGSCIDGVGVHVDAAAAAVQAVLMELEQLVNGMQSIDESAADAVTNV